MRNRTLLPLRLKDDYGLKRLCFFYPDLYPNNKITYRDVIDIYEECLHYKDVEVINLLKENFDLEHILDFDSKFQSEETIYGTNRKSDRRSRMKRIKNSLDGHERLYGEIFIAMCLV